MRASMTQKPGLRAVMSNSTYLSFYDDRSGCEYLLVQDGHRSALWNKSEMSSNELATEVDNWLSPEMEQDEYYVYEE